MPLFSPQNRARKSVCGPVPLSVRFCAFFRPESRRRDGRVVEGARLESVYTPKGYRGFESHSLRQPSRAAGRLSRRRRKAKADWFRATARQASLRGFATTRDFSPRPRRSLSEAEPSRLRASLETARLRRIRGCNRAILRLRPPHVEREPGTWNCPHNPQPEESGPYTPHRLIVCPQNDGEIPCNSSHLSGIPHPRGKF
jgi:hypothetical protein